jgi:hypothetical protein
MHQRNNGSAKLTPEEKLWVRGTTVPTLIKEKFPIIVLQQKVITKCLKKNMYKQSCAQHMDLLLQKPLISCVHILINCK